MAVNSGRITVTSLGAGWVPDLWADETLDGIQFEIVLADSFDTSFEKSLPYGDVLNVKRSSNPTTQTKTAGSDVTFEQITETNQTITVSTHEYGAVYVEDIAEAQAKGNVRATNIKKFAYTLARGLEVTCAAQFQSYSTLGGNGLGVPLTADTIDEAMLSLDKAGVPMSDRFLDISPKGKVALGRLEEFRSTLYGGAGERYTQQGEFLGSVRGAKVLVSNLLRAAASGQADGAMRHRTQDVLIRQIKPTTVELHNPAGIGVQIVMHNLYGVQEMDRPPETPGGGTAVDTWGVYLRHDQ